MPIVTNSFEGVTPAGTTLTTANSGGLSGTAFTTVGTTSTSPVSATGAAHGYLCMSVSNSNVAANSYMQWTSASAFGSQATTYFLLYAYITAAPNATVRLFNMTSTSGTASVMSVQLTSAAKLQITYGSSGTSYVVFTAACPTNSWFRVEGFAVASATVGQVSASLFSTSMDGLVADETHTSAASLNTGALSGTTTYSFGDSGSTALTSAILFDDIGLSSLGPLGPSIAQPAQPPPMAIYPPGWFPGGPSDPGNPPFVAQLPLVIPLAGLIETSNAEGGSSGTTVSAGNSGGASGNAWDAVAIGSGAGLTFDSTQTAHGSLSYNVSTGGSSTTSFLEWTSASVGTQATLYFRVYVYQPNLSTSNAPFRVLSGGSHAGDFAITTAGVIALRNGAYTTLLSFTTVIPTSQWVRIEGYFTGDAVHGVISCSLYLNMDSITATETHTVTGANTVGVLNGAYFGQGNTVASSQYWLDDLGISNTGPLGPVIPTVYAAATTLAGTGSIAAPSTQQAAATLAGTGSIAAPSTLSVTATLAGTGSIAASSSQSALATLSGTGSLTALGGLSAAVVLSGAGSITASGAPTEVSPALEAYDFGPFPQIPANSAITSVTVVISEWASGAEMAGTTFQLWDGIANTQIGSNQTGNASTSPANLDTAVFTGVSYSQLAGLRVRIYANALASGVTEMTATVSLVVTFTPAVNAYTAPGDALAEVAMFPAVTASGGINATAQPGDALAGAAVFPAVTVSNGVNDTASPAVLVCAAAFPAVTASGVISATASPAVLACASQVVAALVVASSTGPDYAGAMDTLPGGLGSWANVAGAVGPPDGTDATWTSP
jgi:hypothetical protein